MVNIVRTLLGMDEAEPEKPKPKKAVKAKRAKPKKAVKVENKSKPDPRLEREVEFVRPTKVKREAEPDAE